MAWFTFVTGYKKSWYDEHGKDLKMNVEEFKDDFAIIEQIIESTGVDKQEGYSFASLFGDIIEKVQDQYFNNETVKDQYAGNQDDKRDGLRTILFIVLQMCIMAYSENVETDLTEFWKTMNFYVKKESGKVWPLCVYAALFRHMMTLTIGFQNEPVSYI